MNHVDSDLEEGEILDDSPSSPCINEKHRELPRRYVVHEKPSPIHKHKRDCKYAIHYHSKKIAKLRKSPKYKNCHKKHRKSTCPHEKSRRPSDKISSNVEKNFSKSCHSFPNYSLIAEIKESIKDHSIKKQSTKQVSKSDKSISETEKIKDNNSKSEIGRENVNSPVYDSKHCSQSSINNADDLSEVIEIISDSDTKTVCNSTSDSSSKEKNEESEDEEELRRIALATCAKRKAYVESSENLSKTADINTVSASGSPYINNVQMPHHEISSPASDNYEVVDMEVDEDSEASIEILENFEKDQNSEFLEKLFVIDTKPSGDFKENVQENASPEIHSNSDDNFEIDILRAELIESLCRKKCLQDECIEEEKSNVNVHQAPTLQKQLPTLPQKKHIGKYKKLNANVYRKQLQPGKHTLKKTIINNKAKKLHCNSNKPPPPLQVNKSERLVIALNEESSSEESSVDSESENPVASIEALISDCRQKSDSSEKNQESITNVPKAVSCLSKAQQEEYTSLVKILAKKEKLQGPSDAFQHKNGSVRFPLDDLKLLERKLAGFKETLKEKKEFMTYLSKEINSKKSLYMKSKLAAQHLREQYIAAEKLRKANLYTWSKSCSDFKSVKKTVSNLESKIIQLQSLCSKVGASIQGQTYNLPLLPAGNR